MKLRVWPLLALTATVLSPVSALATFRCPAADPTAAGDTAGTGVSDALRADIRRMLSTGMKGGEIVDRLVAADCRRIDAEPNMSDDDKARQVRRFASRIVGVVYAAPGNGEEDVLLDVPVPTSRYEELGRAAAEAGVSEDAWVNQAIATKLGRP